MKKIRWWIQKKVTLATTKYCWEQNYDNDNPYEYESIQEKHTCKGKVYLGYPSTRSERKG